MLAFCMSNRASDSLFSYGNDFEAPRATIQEGFREGSDGRNRKLRFLLVIPPWMNYHAGPMLGPSLISSRLRQLGWVVEMLNLNQKLFNDVHRPATSRPGIIGDHAKSPAWCTEATARLDGLLYPNCCIKDLEWLRWSQNEVRAVTSKLARGRLGNWLQTHVPSTKPDILGLSIMWDSQVVPALTLALVARRLWPKVRIVAGGAHVTALSAILDDEFFDPVDILVTGHTHNCDKEFWSRLADSDCPIVMRASEFRVIPPLPPVFEDLDDFSSNGLTLPVQASTGCPYNRCRFCTYPAMEGAYEELSISHLEEGILQAVELNAQVSFKDSLITPPLLDNLAQQIAGRVKWSACTKIHSTIDSDRISAWKRGGLRTLEIGLESLLPEIQDLIDKVQPSCDFWALVNATRGSGVALIVNYMTGFPGEDATRAALALHELKARLSAIPDLNAWVNHSVFQLERCSLFGLNPSEWGIKVTGSWPWSSIQSWTSLRQTGHEADEMALEVSGETDGFNGLYNRSVPK